MEEKKGMVAKAKLLEMLVRGEETKDAPTKTERYGKHYEFLVAVGNDNTASITMDDETYKALMDGKYLAIESI